MSGHILSSVADGVGTILFNRPEMLNAANDEMLAEMSAIAQRFERDDQVRAVLIRGAGDTFMAGADVKSFHAAVTTDQAAYAAELERRVVAGQVGIHRLRRMRKPVLVCVQGAAAGLGLSLVTAADLAIAADDAVFTLAYRHVGLTGDGGVSYFLPRIVGERRALEIALLGERFTARQALDWGLVNWIEPAATLQDRALAIARKLAQGPTAALGGIKTLLRNSLDTSWEEQSMREAESISGIAASADHREGLAAFMEKRAPRFVGH